MIVLIFMVAGNAFSQINSEGSVFRSEIEIGGDIFIVRHEYVSEAELIVATGRLISRPESDPVASKNPRYKILEVDRGRIHHDEIVVHSRHNSTLGSPPDHAILILNAKGSDNISYIAIGDDIKYGVIPYSDEAWSSVRKTPTCQLTKNRKDRVIPLADALEQAFNAARHEYANMSYNVLDVKVFPLGNNRYSVIRYGYSWSMLLKVTAASKDKDDLIYEYYQQIRIYDDGHPKLSRLRTIGSRY